jgi:ATP-dependent Clp protease ATP-binding subunit ClpC
MVRVRFLEGPAALSAQAQKVFQLAHQEAHRLCHPAVGTDHLLLGIAKEGSSPAAVMLQKHGFDLLWLRARVARVNPPGPVAQTLPGTLPYAPDLELFLSTLIAAAEAASVTVLTPEYLLTALAEETDGIAIRILRQRWFALWRLRRKLRRGVE